MLHFPPPNRLVRLQFACLILAASHAAVYADDNRVTAVRALLEHDLLPEELPLHEVEDFTEARTPLMPDLTSVEAWQAEADRIRRDVLEKVVFRGAAAGWRDAETRVEWLDTIAGGEGYHIKKLRYEALPGLWIPALLYEPDELRGKAPVALNVNGHEAKGKAAPYKQIRCINLAKRGMLALNVEWLGMGQLRGEGYVHYRMNQLDLCGTSGLAPFYLAMSRGLDVLLSHPHADPERVAVAGLSGGGWQTITISSLDPRVTLANPVAGYSSFRTRARNHSDLGDSEQTPSDLGSVADYTHLTALRAPRPTLLTFNAKDNCCFAADHALQPLLDAASPVYKLFGVEDRLRSHINYDPGNHNFERDNREAFYRAIGDFFYTGDETFSAIEIESEAEVKTAEELHVELPGENADFHTLALGLAKDLPRRAPPPEADEELPAWRAGRVEELQSILRTQRFNVVAEDAGSEVQGDVRATFWRLRIGDAWTVPAVELSAGEPEPTALLVADGGRTAACESAAELLDRGFRVVAVDPFYWGESRIAKSDSLFALLTASLGDRPAGIQASQIAAVARWLKNDRNDGGVAVYAVGGRACLAALGAAAIEDNAIQRITLRDSLGSLQEVIEENGSVEQAPELFCFGLLEKFDIRDLATLIAPRPVSFEKPSDRVRVQMAGLDSWFARWNAPHDPLGDSP